MFLFVGLSPVMLLWVTSFKKKILKFQFGCCCCCF